MPWRKKIFRFKFSEDERTNLILAFHLNQLVGTSLSHTFVTNRYALFMELRFWIKCEEVNGKPDIQLQARMLELLTRDEMRYKSFHNVNDEVIKIFETKDWEKIECLLIDVTNS